MLQDVCEYPTAEQIAAASGPIALDTETLGTERDTNLPMYFSWAARDLGSGGGPIITEAGYAAARRLCENERPKIAHNLKFDMQRFEQAGIKLQGKLHDTSIMHCLLDEHHAEFHRLKALSRELLGRDRDDERVMKQLWKRHHYFDAIPQSVSHPYAVHDAEDALDLFYLFEPQLREQGLWDLYEHEIIATIAYKDMEQYGIGIDIAALEVALARIGKALDALSDEIHQKLGNFLISSPEQLGNKLYEAGVPLTERTEGGNWGTSKGALEPFKHLPIVQTVLAWRFLTKATSTLNNYRFWARNGRVYPEYRLTTTTGRSAAKEPPIQQIPKQRGRITEIEAGTKELALLCAEAFRSVRAVFIPSPGARLLSFDYSQIEFCVFVHYAQARKLIEALRAGKIDIHEAVARIVFGTYDDRIRHITKMLNYGILYGMSHKRMGEQLAGEMFDGDPIAIYENAVPEMRITQNRIKAIGRARGYVKDVFGRHYRLRQEIGDYILVAWICQGTAANIKKRALGRVAALLQGRRSRVCADIHDELVFNFFPEDRDLIPLIVEEMERFPELSVPIRTNGSIGANFLEMKKMSVAELQGDEPWKSLSGLSS